MYHTAFMHFAIFLMKIKPLDPTLKAQFNQMNGIQM